MEARIRYALSRFATIGAIAALLWVDPGAAAEVYRWVDENGEVHYSATLPPEHRDRGHDVLNQQGIVVDENQKLTPEPLPPSGQDEPQELPRDASGLPRPKALYSETELQQRQDSFLLLRYGSEEEILEAMNVEIKQLNYDRRLLDGSRASTNQAYRGQIRVAAERQRAGLPVQAETTREISKLRNALAANSESIAALQLREDAIRADFQKQLERYRYLIENWSEDASGS